MVQGMAACRAVFACMSSPSCSHEIVSSAKTDALENVFVHPHCMQFLIVKHDDCEASTRTSTGHSVVLCAVSREWSLYYTLSHSRLRHFDGSLAVAESHIETPFMASTFKLFNHILRSFLSLPLCLV